MKNSSVCNIVRWKKIGKKNVLKCKIVWRFVNRRVVFLIVYLYAFLERRFPINARRKFGDTFFVRNIIIDGAFFVCLRFRFYKILKEYDSDV